MFGGGNGSDSGGESEEAEEEKTQRRRDWHAALNANSSVDRKRRAKEARKRYSYAAYADDRSRPPQQQRGSSFAAFAPGGGHASTFDRFDSGADDGGAGDGGDGIPLEGGVGGTAAAAGAIYREMDEGGSMSRAAKLCRRLTPQPVRHAILPPGLRWSEWKRFLFIHVPILQWLLAYRPKQLLGDAIAGITIGVTHIPQGRAVAYLGRWVGTWAAGRWCGVCKLCINSVWGWISTLKYSFPMSCHSKCASNKTNANCQIVGK